MFSEAPRFHIEILRPFLESRFILSVSYSFFFYRSLSSLLKNFHAEVFVFGDFNVHHKTGQPILVELIDQANLVIIFQSKTDVPK